MNITFSSMYPHIIIAFNIERNTMIGKLFIDHQYLNDRYEHHFVKDSKYKDDDEIEDTSYDAGKDFVDNYLTEDVLSIGTKWFDLPTISELDTKFRKEFGIKDKIVHMGYKLYTFVDKLFVNIK